MKLFIDENPELSYRQLKVLLKFLRFKYHLENKFFPSLGVISMICSLHLVNDLEKQKDWLFNEKILVFDDIRGYKINFDAVAYVLFVKYNTNVLYEFAWEYMSIPNVDKKRVSHSLFSRVFRL